MPARPLRPCASPGCSNLVVKGRCPAHAVQPDPRVGRRKVYDLRSWRGPNGLRIRKLKANPLCEQCERDGVVASAEAVDHADGDATNNAWSNLVSLCWSCHSRKTVKQDGGFGRTPGGDVKSGVSAKVNDRPLKRILMFWSSPQRLSVFESRRSRR